jgi:predicted secreted hydrolase
VPAGAQGFADLGTDAEGFAIPDPDHRFEFPEDHGPHPAFRIEWWYVTANLTGPDGTPYGIQWTLFRSALRPEDGEGWETPQLWMGHAGMTTPDQHFVAERLARGGVGQAEVTPEPFAARIDDWEMAGPSLSDVRLTARGDGFGYDLRLMAGGPFVPQGIAGYSVKSAEGQASHYYSQPFYAVEGTLDIGEAQAAVTGQGWLDREWSSQPLSEDQTGWDWFSLHLDTGEKVMGFRLRDRDGGAFTSATWIAPDGTPDPQPPGAFEAEPLGWTDVAGRRVPTDWRVRLPERGLDVRVTAVNPLSWMETLFPYWEGPVRISGSHSGVGYLEMTGHD